MRIGLMADSHDRLPAIAALLAKMLEGNVGLVLHAGDFCSPFALTPFFDVNAPMGGVFGRNDGDREGLRAHASKGVGIELFESPHSFEVAGKQILLVHDVGEVSQRSLDAHAVVVHGHSHQVEMKERGSTLLINPGEACGWLYGTPSAAILDLTTMRVEMLHLEGERWRQ